tara:strand:- start:267 stop:398 length:132 start_codon:yes stop_codon:yes gene_type:complete
MDKWIKGVSGAAASFRKFQAGRKYNAPVLFKKINGEWYHMRKK